VQQASLTVQKAKRLSEGGGDRKEALARPFAAKIELNNLSMKKSSKLVTRYLDYI
jgi:hypothetical protein